ncbi:MAG TPA: hypothetical protein VFP91_02560 [Vicinamibacterales bacterium]|nr:hypothetical protein [Vicinamibacterales bacterium]
MDRGKALAVAGALLGVLLFAPEPALAQCAMCRRALQSPEGQQMVAAFRSGILVLLAAPFSLLGVVAMLVVRMRRRGSFKRF